MKTATDANKTNYNGLDLLKFILANLIIILHCGPLKDVSEVGHFYLEKGLTRLAVPMFFCISGFLVFRKIDVEHLDMKNLWKAIKRPFTLYVVWTIMYMPLIIPNFMTEKYAGMSILKKIIIFIRRFCLIGSWTPLWFFLGLCTATVVICVLLKMKLHPKMILLITLLLYLCGCLSDGYSWIGYVLIEKVDWLNKLCSIYTYIFGITNNGFLFGAFFMAMGMFIAKMKKPCISGKKALVLFIGSFIVLLIEITAISQYEPRDYSKLLALIPCTYFGFCFFKDLNLKDSKIWIYLRNMSVLMYGLHALFTEVNIENRVELYLFVLPVTLLCSVIIILLQKRVKWLKIFY